MASDDLGSVLGGSGVVLSILGMIYTAINHKRIRGRCCGREIDIEVNIDSTEPAAAAPNVQGEAPPATPKTTAKVYPYKESYPDVP